MAKFVVDSDEVFEPEEAAKQIGISLATLWRWVKAHKITPLRVSGRTYFTAEDIARVKKEQTELDEPVAQVGEGFGETDDGLSLP